MRNPLLLSFVLGFTTASPLGPTGLLCLRRTLSRGPMTGFISALGISCAYAFWSYAAIHGLKTISHWIEQEKIILQIAIGLFFFLYGLYGIFKTTKLNYPEFQDKGGVEDFLSTFLVVFFNPGTLIMFTALFTLFGLTKQYFDQVESVEIASSVFAGSILFWIVVSQLVYRIRVHMNDSTYNSIARISSYLILVFGIAIIFNCLRYN